ncbi:MAG: hypothetical protein ACOYI8_11010 [Christensenellales bacterium]|jgi:hypothetical protein
MRKKKRPHSGNRALALWLVLCYPVGLYKVWKRRCKWKIWAKLLLTIPAVAIVVFAALSRTEPPEYRKGGVEIVYRDPEEEMVGPELSEDSGTLDVYVPVYVPDTSLIVSPTPTPLPIYVYCNDGGQCYHAQNCRYVKSTTPRVTLSQAVNAGFKQCSICNCPNEKGVYRDGTKGYRMPDPTEPPQDSQG